MVIEKSNLLALAIGRRKEATAIVQIYPIGANEKSEILINNCLAEVFLQFNACLLYTSPSPRDATLSRMPSSA